MFYGQRRGRRTERALVVVTGCWIAACTGSIEGARPWNDPQALSSNTDISAPNLPGAPAANGGYNAMTNPGNPLTGGPGSTQGQGGATCNVGASPLRRLTHAEYNNAVRDLLGDTTRPADNFVADTQVGLFDNTADSQTVPSLLADQYLDAAVGLGTNVSDVKALMGCDPAAAGTTCVRGFIAAFGRRAYRRPLTSDETASLVDLYTQARSSSDAPTAVRGMIAAILVSPHFLFRPEFGGTTGNFANTKHLTQYEQAARLASLLWASIPDDQLLAAAEANQLATPAQLEAQARRMLGDPKAAPAVSAFFDQWLGLEQLDSATKDPAMFPNFDDELRASMVEERRRFVDHVLWEDGAQLTTLLTADYSFVNKPLAALYGVTSSAKGSDDYVQVDLDATQRAGVMTQAAMLAAFARTDESSPVKRGKWVRVRMLCQDLPDPPADVPQLAALEQGVSNRERFAMHTNNPACSGCHQLIDGLGFGLEHYDTLGAYRTMNQGVAVDASGLVNSTQDIDGPYEGGPALAKRLAGSEQVRNCVPTQALRYAWGRRETSDDACSVATVQKAFADSDGDLQELMVALTQTDTFTNYRQAD